MKIIKTLLIVIVVIILLAGVGLFVFLRTFDINKYLPAITKQVSDSIHRPVAIDHAKLDFGLTTGIVIKVDNLRIGNEAQVNTNDLLATKEINVQVDLLPLLKKEIHINKVNLQNTKLLIEDPKSKMSYHVLIDDIQAKASNFSLSEPFDFTVAIKAYSKDQANIQVAGHGELDLTKSKVNISNLNIQSDLSKLDLNQIKTISAVFQSLPVWPKDIKGNLDVKIPALVASDKGLESLTANVKLSSGSIKLKELFSPIDQINLLIEADLNTLSLKSLQAHIGTGEINGVSQITDFLKAPHYTFQLQAKSIKVEELLDEGVWPAQLKGAIEGNFSGSGDSFDPELMQNNLKGSGSFNLINGRIEKFNILKMITEKLSFIPGLSDQINKNLSAKVKEKLDQETTLLDKAQAKIDVRNRIVSIEDAQVTSQVFSIAAQGSVGFDQTINMDVKAYLEPDVSADLSKSVQPLQALLEDQGRLYVPGIVSGKVPAISYSPQIDYITKKVAISQGAQQLEKVLDKNPQVKNILNSVLGDGSQDSQNDGESSKKIINNIFNKILK